MDSLNDELTNRATRNEGTHRDRSEIKLLSNGGLEDIEKSDISGSKGTKDKVGARSKENAIAGPNINLIDKCFDVNEADIEMSTKDITIDNDKSKPGKFDVINIILIIHLMFKINFDRLNGKFHLKLYFAILSARKSGN